MDFELNETPTPRGEAPRSRNAAGFEISPAPLIETETSGDAGGLPRSSGGPLLCLMARDPHTLFAYWEIDWTDAFAAGEPSDRKVHLRVTQSDGAAQTIEVEPLAGSCYLNVESADATYHGDIGYYRPAAVWNSLATAANISTPPEDLADLADDNFATVPFHLSFQHMIDMLRETRREQAPLVVHLADVRDRANAGSSTGESLTSGERDIAHAMQELETTTGATERPQTNTAAVWRRQRFERILGFGGTSPGEGFTGGS